MEEQSVELVEKSGNTIYVMKIPATYLNVESPNEVKAVGDAYIEALKEIANGSRNHISFPSETYMDGEPMFSLTVLKA